MLMTIKIYFHNQHLHMQFVLKAYPCQLNKIEYKNNTVFVRNMRNANYFIWKYLLCDWKVDLIFISRPEWFWKF